MTLEVVSPTAALLDGRYLLEDRVGKGGMATVYRAEDTRLGRTVAIKMIHEGESLLGSADRAHTEKALLASLSHPALVTLFDAQLEPGRPQYLVMEFVDGPTLADRMSTGPIPPVHLAHILRDLAEGLAAVHSAGIVHRDVKPSNVLMAPARKGAAGQWTAKLADFGIAYSLDDTPRLTTPGVVLGTLTYMAPEQLTDKDPGTPIDVFALGLIALEALTGDCGYPALGSGRAAAVARVTHPPTIAEHVDPQWRDLIERMTRLEPAERPTADEVARAARALARRDSSDDAEPLFPAGAAVAREDTRRAAVAGPVAGAAAVAGAASAQGAASAPEPTSAYGAASAPGATPTDATAVLPPVAGTAPSNAPAAAPSRVRRRVLIGAGALAAVGALVTTAAMLNPIAADAARTAAETVVRVAVEPTDTPAETVPDAVVDEPVTPVETVTDPVDQGNGNENKGSENKGNENKGSDNKGSGNGNKPEKPDKPDKGKG